jgi:hypothetical protein
VDYKRCWSSYAANSKVNRKWSWPPSVIVGVVSVARSTPLAPPIARRRRKRCLLARASPAGKAQCTGGGSGPSTPVDALGHTGRPSISLSGVSAAGNDEPLVPYYVSTGFLRVRACCLGSGAGGLVWRGVKAHVAPSLFLAISPQVMNGLPLPAPLSVAGCSTSRGGRCGPQYIQGESPAIGERG